VTALAHHVRIGHTEFLRWPVPAAVAVCDEHGPACLWLESTGHARADGVHHAEQAGHRVRVAEGRTITTIEVTS
jgi:hypothetical protein